MLKAFRVSGVKLEVDSTVPKSISFFESLDGIRKEIEEVFENNRPKSKPKRSESRFVFESLEAAKDFICTKENHYLYEVNVKESNILHKGDWKWLEIAKKKNKNECAKKYWDSELTQSHIIEWIVLSAKVVKEIEVSSLERMEIARKKYNMPPLADLSNFDSLSN